MTPKRIALLVVTIVVVGALALFYFQNSATQVNVIFKLTPGLAWDLGEGVKLPILLLCTFGLGAAIVGGVLGTLMMRANRKVRALRRQVDSLEDELEFHRSDVGKTRPMPKQTPKQTPKPPVQDDHPLMGDSFDDLI